MLKSKNKSEDRSPRSARVAKTDNSGRPMLGTLPDFDFPSILLIKTCSYLKAECWEDLAAVAYQSFNDCAVDKMLRLVQGHCSSSTSSDGLAVMQFSSEPGLFSPYVQSPLVFDISKSKLCPTATVFVPRASVLSATAARALTVSQNMYNKFAKVLGLAQQNNERPEVPLNEQALMNRRTSRPISVEDLEAPATPEEIRAAIVIQVAYKRALRRRAAPPPKDERVKLWYEQCLDAQTHLQGPKSYSQYFLGPLVHVLIWVDTLVRLLKSRRERIRRRLNKNTDHIQIEDLMERWTICE
jgi:hypothetical protein